MQIYVTSYNPDYTSYYPFHRASPTPTTWGNYLWQDRNLPGFRVPNKGYGESREPGLAIGRYSVDDWFGDGSELVISLEEAVILPNAGIVVKLSKTAESYVPSVYKRLFTNVYADGSAEETTTKITLVFDMDIADLSAADIDITPNGTGATKGALARKGEGKYELRLTGITKSGNISVALNKSGHEPRPAYRNVYVWKNGDPADTGTWDYYFWAASATTEIYISDLRDKGWSEYHGHPEASYGYFKPFDRGVTEEMFLSEEWGGSACMQIYISGQSYPLPADFDSYTGWARVPNDGYGEEPASIHEITYTKVHYYVDETGTIDYIFTGAQGRLIKISKVK